MWILLIKVLLILGAAVLTGLIVKVLLLTAQKLFELVKEKLRKAVGNRVLVAAVKSLANELEKERLKGKNTHKIDDILSELGSEGAVTAVVGADGEIDESSIMIMRAEKVDDHLNGILNANDGMMLVEG